MYKNNRTSEWLNDKSVTEKEAIIGNAVKEQRNYKKGIISRKKKLFENSVKLIKEREETVKQRRLKVKKKHESAMNDLEKYGLWENKKKVEDGIDKILIKKDKISAVKKQLNLYKNRI